MLSLIFQLFLVSAATAATPDTRWLDARQIEYRITGEYDGQFLLDATGTPMPAHTLNEGEMVMIPTRGEYMMDPSQLNSPDRQLDPKTGTITERKSGWTWRYQAT